MFLFIEFFPTIAKGCWSSIQLLDEWFSCEHLCASKGEGALSYRQIVLSFAQEWQTLIAGLLAMLPASAAAVFVWKQLNEQRIQFLQLQKRDAQKSRLRLSRNLAEISNFSDDAYKRLISGKLNSEDHFLPEKMVDDILDAGVLAGHENFEFFKSYTSRIQQYYSYCRLFEESGGENNLVNCFGILAEIDIMTDRLYPFARFETDEISVAEVDPTERKAYLLHNLRRHQDITGTNLDELMKLGRFD